MVVIQFLHETRFVFFLSLMFILSGIILTSHKYDISDQLGMHKFFILIGWGGSQESDVMMFSESHYYYSLCHSNDHIFQYYLLHYYTKILKLLFVFIVFIFSLSPTGLGKERQQNQNVNPRNAAILTSLAL